MQYGINLPPFADFADPRALAALAHEAEESGWDGFFIWDHIIFDPTWHPIADPWVGLAAVALSTKRIRLGTLLTPLPRRRPWKLARETVGVDLLADGRLVLGVGLGDPVEWDFGWFGEETARPAQARRLDEGLDILTGLWSGEPFSYAGDVYRVDEVRFQPRPRQSPRIPIWVGGQWPNKAPMRRAARWDGVAPMRWGPPLTPADWREILAYIKTLRPGDGHFDAVHTSGETPGDDPAAAAEIVAPFAEVGVTWWLESLNPWRWGWSWEEAWPPEATRLIRERVRQGPPKL